MLRTKKTKMNKNLTSCHKELLSNAKDNQGRKVVNPMKVIPSVLLEQRGRSLYLSLEVSEKISQRRWTAYTMPSGCHLKRSKGKEVLIGKARQKKSRHMIMACRHGGYLPGFPRSRGGSWDTALAVLKPGKSYANQDELVIVQGNCIPLVGQDECFEKEWITHSEVHYCYFFLGMWCVHMCASEYKWNPKRPFFHVFPTFLKHFWAPSCSENEPRPVFQSKHILQARQPLNT